MEPLSQGPDGTSVAKEGGDNGLALVLVLVVVIGVIFWFGANVVGAFAASCGGG